MANNQGTHSHQVDWARLGDAISQAMQRGLPLPKFFAALAEEAPDPSTKATLRGLVERINRGESLAEALQAISVKKSRELRGILAAASATPQPGESFLRLLQSSKEFAEQLLSLRSALGYPVICGALTTAGLALLAWNWLHLENHEPDYSLSGMVSNARQVESPLEMFFGAVWWPLTALLASLLVVLGFLVLLRVVINPRSLARRGWIYRIPILGRYYKALAITRFCEVLGYLVGTSVRLPEALRLTAGLTDWPRLRRALVAVAPRIESGVPLAEALSQFRWFPSVAIIYLAESEQAVPLQERLKACGELYGDVARGLISRLEGIFILFMLIGIYPFVQFAFTCATWVARLAS